MWRYLLQNQCRIGIPKHIAIVLDGKQKKNADIDLQPLFDVHLYFGIRYLSLVLVSQTSLGLPSSELNESVSKIKDEISKYRQIKFPFRYKMELFGDLDLFPDKVVASEIRELVETGNDDEPQVVVRLGMFYSSTNELLKKASAMAGTHQLSWAGLLADDRPPIDLFLRTSGLSRASDLMLPELSTFPVFTVFEQFSFGQLSRFKFYKLLTRWQFFRIDRDYTMNKDKNRFNYAQKGKQVQPIGDEIDQLREEFNSDTLSTSEGGHRYSYFINK